MLDKIKVKENYLKGYSYNKIANILKEKPETVKKCIQRNLKEFRKSHAAEKIRRKEVDRITRQESKKYMSDKDFIKRNRSIYKTKKNGDIILNKDVVVTFDTPKRLTNEYSEDKINKAIIKSDYRKENDVVIM
ncbi:DNA-binding response regulator [Clostridium botulinum]|uniref:DNA-binding response regulator n=1 Tax=Clostridium botulinum TaxID=1491 RepID=UPI001967CCC1|nr:DNA-binding response regulator [Clostridium botulinum]MBN1050285.1 DNA-binding response regulator [Clostridium botulinum]